MILTNDRTGAETAHKAAVSERVVVEGKQIEKRQDPLPLKNCRRNPAACTSPAEEPTARHLFRCLGGIYIRGMGGSPNSQILVVEDGAPDYQGIFGHPIPMRFFVDDDKVTVIKVAMGSLWHKCHGSDRYPDAGLKKGICLENNVAVVLLTPFVKTSLSFTVKQNRRSNGNKLLYNRWTPGRSRGKQFGRSCCH
jgi:hypothetical protein